MLFSWLIVSGTAVCSSNSAPPPVTGTSRPLASRNASSNSWAFSTMTVSWVPAASCTSFAVQLKQVP